MSSDYDATDFVDGDFHNHKSPFSATSGAGSSTQRAPTREEVDSKVAEAQKKLTELKRVQEELERERAALEETRRRQMEFQTGRQEMLQHLTRGTGLLEEAEFSARRDAEQMAKGLQGLRDALGKVQSIHEEAWSKDNFDTELTRALTILENARMEWNAARLKFPVLSNPGQSVPAGEDAESASQPVLATRGFGELCRLGFGLTWPLALVVLIASGILLVVLLRR
jgi:hypothetical protein